jgi:(2Fe-2S) ferredoxin
VPELAESHHSIAGPAVPLLARSAISAPPLKEMERFRSVAAGLPGVGSALFAFSEQGSPSLRHAIHELVAAECERVTIVPMQLPFEASFQAWLTRSLTRWRQQDERRWPQITLAPLLAGDDSVAQALRASLAIAAVPLVLETTKTAVEGSIVPSPKRRVLVCMGGPCNVAGAEIVWGHLRNEQDRLSLRTASDGTMSAKTSCLGPCNLAPVVQVWPEGTYYGGVDEAGIDRIIASHLIDGEPVADLLYEATGKKQTLRPKSA